MAKTGVMTGNLKLRSGLGMEFEPPLDYLVPGTSLEILDEQGAWLHVRVKGKEGYVGSKYVEISPDQGTDSTGGIPDVKPAGMPEDIWEKMKNK
jgi:hypothetical protein